MFYFKITERQKRSGEPKTSKTAYREYLRTADLGEAVALMVATRETTSISVTKISQAAYMRATRSD